MRSQKSNCEILREVKFVLRVFFWTLFKVFKLGIPFFIESPERVQIQVGSNMQARNEFSLSCVQFFNRTTISLIYTSNNRSQPKVF